jgi:hypothetical protein
MASISSHIAKVRRRPDPDRDAQELRACGELEEILERLGNLIDAAKTAPGQFETAAYEELLGGNLDQPLSPAELMAAGRMPPSSAAGPGVCRPRHATCRSGT